jgi:hypothetical protein
VSEVTGLRCSTWARQQQVDPVGTAGSYDGFLVVDWPLPWPRDAGDVPDLAPVVAALRTTGVRLQLTIPTDERRRVSLHRAVGSPRFRGYGTATVEVGAGDVVGAAIELLGSPGPVEPGDRREVLVCTHGKRDACCGSIGTSFAAELAADVRLAAVGVTVRRTSHLGGHRFAPTALVLPEGSVWAYLDADTLVGVLARTLDPAQAVAHFRGCSGLGPARLQALDASVLREVGWDLLDRARSGTVDGDWAMLEVDGHGRWEAEVREGRRLPVPDCGRLPDEGAKAEPELRVGPLTHST